MKKINRLRTYNQNKILEIYFDKINIVNKYLVFENGKLNLSNIDFIYINTEYKGKYFLAEIMITISGKEYQIDLERSYSNHHIESNLTSKIDEENKSEFFKEVEYIKTIINEIESLTEVNEF